MKFVPIAVSSTLARQALRVRKNSPVIMFGAGIATAVTATVFACKATLHVDEVITAAEKDRLRMDEAIVKFPDRYSDQQRREDLHFVRVKTAVKIGKLYAPAIGLGVISIGLLTGSHLVLTRRNVALTAAYTVLDKGFREYRERVVKEFGEDKDREFRYGTIAKEIVEEGEHGHEVKTVQRIGAHGRSIYARPFDQNNRHWSRHPMDNRSFIMNMQSWANDKLGANGSLLLNDVYDMLGMDRSVEGCVVGWVKDRKRTGGDGYVSFGLDADRQEVRDFMMGDEGAVWLDFNVDGVVYKFI